MPFQRSSEKRTGAAELRRKRTPIVRTPATVARSCGARMQRGVTARPVIRSNCVSLTPATAPVAGATGVAVGAGVGSGLTCGAGSAATDSVCRAVALPAPSESRTASVTV